MFNPTQVVIEAFVQELQAMYLRNYGVLEPNYPGFIAFISRGAMSAVRHSADGGVTVRFTVVGATSLSFGFAIEIKPPWSRL